MAPPAWAYQIENFNPSPDEELVCSICQSVFCDPVQSPCHHVFCRNCIGKWIETNRNCPICRKRTTRSSLQEVVPLVKNMIMKLVLNCHNLERGCPEKFPLENCEAHVKNCNYELVQCKNKPCKVTLMKGEIKDHELNKCAHSYIRCKTCDLKISSRNPDAHNCITELLKKLKEKTDKLKKNNLKIKKLKEELKNLKESDEFSSETSMDSLITSDVLFEFADNHDASSGSSLSDYSLYEENGNDWVVGATQYPFIEQARSFDFFASAEPEQQGEDSIEYPRASSPFNFEDSSVIEIDAVEPALEDEPLRRPAKRRHPAQILDSSDEDDLQVSPLPSRKRTSHMLHNAVGESSAAAHSDLAGTSYISSNTDTSLSTTDSAASSREIRWSRSKLLRSRGRQQSSTMDTVAANTMATLQNNPIFERTLSLLEQYNLESDPEWMPERERGSDDSDDSDNDLYVPPPGHITSSDESSMSDLLSDSSYEDAAEGRTSDLLNSLYRSSDSDSDYECQPQ